MTLPTPYTDPEHRKYLARAVAAAGLPLRVEFNGLFVIKSDLPDTEWHNNVRVTNQRQAFACLTRTDATAAYIRLRDAMLAERGLLVDQLT